MIISCLVCRRSVKLKFVEKLLFAIAQICYSNYACFKYQLLFYLSKRDTYAILICLNLFMILSRVELCINSLYQVIGIYHYVSDLESDKFRLLHYIADIVSN